jgi:hypothetical protein
VVLAESVWQGYLAEILEEGSRNQGAVRAVSMEEVQYTSPLLPDVVMQSPFFLGPLSVMTGLIPTPIEALLVATPLFKIRAGPRMRPRHGLPRDTLLQFAHQIRETTLGILSKTRDWDWDPERFRISHPLFGSRDIYGIMELIRSHDQRHRRQIEAAKACRRFPKSRRTSG